MNQRTIENSIIIEGTGLHTGEKVSIELKPAPVNTGFMFIRKAHGETKEDLLIKAEIDSLLDVEEYPRRTSITNGTIHIHTIEHLLASILGMGIDNVIIELNGSECPGLDGSSLVFAENIMKVGIKEQDAQKKFFKLKEPVYTSENGSHIIALPSEEFKISYTLDYPNSMIKSQYASFIVNPDVYIREIAPARTFCLEEEIEKLKAIGLGKGSDYNNTVVIGKKGIINNSFRFIDEPVRHKIDDLIGDVALIGMPIKAHIIGIRSGHAINTKFVRKLKEIMKKEKASGIISPSTEQITKRILEVEDIEKILPHRYPFLLVDRIIELEEDKRAVGIKSVSYNEWFFQGHFPGKPVMPGVLLVEAIAQVAGVLMLNKKENRGKIAYFLSIDKAKFRKAVKPGDLLILEVEVDKLKSKVGQISGKAYVDGKPVCEAVLMFSLVER
ncbi:MAG: bifunctional UDP-3-O-[3-hydroxymyristoyl] N-acetylglucosamine deacetylase/3-hydroxyacyl-ACP dehydratase [Candidatus Omnitrophica bacterium]|nr:bifunctional UDP-3-O-[3-hydroxymyristoyl] N-acetylglucosamine deacetylase/3-hydroxyacyl-ACP dehydratase [Candidatus Omnitrophota bacterium]